MNELPVPLDQEEQKSNEDDSTDIKKVLQINETQESIDEFPKLYDEIKKFSSPIINNKEFFNTKALEPDHVFVTGECGDQVFGSDVLEKHEHELNEPWETVVEWPKLWAAPLKKPANQSDPRLRIVGATATVSTFVTVEGHPYKPAPAGKGGFNLGKPFFPSILSNNAVSSPQIYAPAP